MNEQKSVTQKAPSHCSGSSRSKKQAQKDINNERNNKPEVPDCDCFSSDKKPPEPGSYYTHLGMKIFQACEVENYKFLISHRMCCNSGGTSQRNRTTCRIKWETVENRKSFVHRQRRQIQPRVSNR